ncbi:MAG: tetratricopeptide repeat protein [Candidatus Thorarchaeota archaeon]|nr:MAG: tetratricopeptide repeat protein [Candidatus Thorarchaeota archaeon]
MSLESSARRSPVKSALTVAFLILLGGISYAFLQVQGFLPIIPDPTVILGFSFLTFVIIICCGTNILTGTYIQRMTGYSEEEAEYKEGKHLFDLEEWEAALEVFKKILHPEMDHRRALFYGAQCYSKLGEWEGMKEYCKRYLELVPKDAEVWEMLSEAHKRLFEYSEAEEAMQRALELAPK